MSSEKKKDVKKAKKARKIAKYAGLGTLALGAYVGAVFSWAYSSADEKLYFDLGERTVREVTGIEKIQVARVVRPKSTEEIAEALRTSEGPVSIGGARCSMGGQVAEPGSLHLDMRGFNRVLGVDKESSTVTVQAGATWRDIQEKIDGDDLAIEIMQTYSNFTVGGSLSVNAHGRYMGRGPIVQSVRSIRVVLADGSIANASREENSELFFAAIGGYGGVGVIAEATLEVVPNGRVKRVTKTLETSEYAAYFRENIAGDRKVVFHNADLHPPKFESARAISWVETDEPLTVEERLIPRDDEYSLTPFVINELPNYPLGGFLRRNVLEPIFYAKDVVSLRNHEASYDIHELEPKSRAESTFVLREYFVPVPKFDEFVPKMAEIFERNDVRVKNISVRHASADPGTLLGWARGETFAFVVYYEQGTTKEAIEGVGKWSREMVDAVLAVGGTYYLPYQNHPTKEQFDRAYPRASEYFEFKRKVDPKLRFQNSLFYAYGPSPRAERDRTLKALGYMRKDEGQTLLTVPEWYLVWNPLELTAHLEEGRAPDEFPYFESLSEYASLYRKVTKATAGVYPENSEYLTMLRVIGLSTLVEYSIKGGYEKTIGRVARATSSGAASSEDRLILEAQRAYGELIFEEPWYEFRFLPYVSRIWKETPFFGGDFIRRTERKLAFSVEYLVKSLYAELLGRAAKSAYGPPEKNLQVIARAPEGNGSSDATVLHDLGDGTKVLAVERWKTFSVVMPKLARAGYEFSEIAGNDDLAVSVVESVKTPFRPTEGRRMFDSRVVSRPSERRGVFLVPVGRLAAFLREVDASGARLEHLYDY